MYSPSPCAALSSGDFSAFCTTVQAKERRLTGFVRANRADLIERALQKGDGIDVDAERLRALLEHVAAIHRVRREAEQSRCREVV